MEHRFVPPPDPGDVEDVGGGVRLLHYPDGMIRVEHECARWPDEQEPDGVFVKIVAPPLHPDHVVHARRPSTITESIACGGCPLHGYVTNGAWTVAS